MKRILAALIAMVILMSFAGCDVAEIIKGNTANKTEYTEEMTLGSISYRVPATWTTDHDENEHRYFIGEAGNINDGAIVIQYLPGDGLLDTNLEDITKLYSILTQLFGDQELKNKQVKLVSGYPAVEFLREESADDNAVKLKCIVFLTPDGIGIIEAGSLGTLTAEAEAAYKGLLKTVNFPKNSSTEATNGN